MAASSGRNADFSVATNNLSGYLNAVSESREAGTTETTTYGDDWREFIATLKGSGFDVSGLWDSTVDGYMVADFGTSRSFLYGPAGSTAGYVKVSGFVLLDSYDISPELDGSINFSSHYQVTGTLTVGTY